MSLLIAVVLAAQVVLLVMALTPGASDGQSLLVLVLSLVFLGLDLGMLFGRNWRD